MSAIIVDQYGRNINNSNPFPIDKKSKKVSSIIGAFAVAAVAVAKAIGGKDCTVNVLTGNCWINPGTTADNTAIKLAAGMSLDLNVAANLSLISDANGASVQIIIWED